MLNILLAALLLHFSVCSGGDPCPAKAHLAPCTCIQTPVESLVQESDTATTPDLVTTVPSRPQRSISLSTARPSYQNDTYYTIVDCKVSKSITALEETVSNALNRLIVDKLIVASVPPVKEHTLARLPSGWLKKVRVRQFQVTTSMMSPDFIWYGSPFAGQEKSLLWFAAHKCFLSGALTYDTAGTVNTKGLEILPYIQGVDFSNNLLTYIVASSFRYPSTNLSTVILSRNSIQTVEASTFQYITYLRYVDLSHNLLESVTRNIFASPARSLRHIDLSWNSLTALPADFFGNMPALKVVNMAYNFLYSMPDKPWGLVWRQLTYIDVTKNPVGCNCELMWLLPILSPSEVNVTTTPVPKPLSGQTVKGDCYTTIQPTLFAAKHALVTLTRGHLEC